MLRKAQEALRAGLSSEGVTEWERENLRLYGPPGATTDDLEWDWNWPTPPKCSGNRHYVTFPSVILRPGDTLRVEILDTPFGFTVVGP